MEEYGYNGQPVNFTGKFYLSFSKDREEVFNLMTDQHLKTMSPLQHFFSRQFRIMNQIPA
jgi:hypothetical protein